MAAQYMFRQWCCIWTNWGNGKEQVSTEGCIFKIKSTFVMLTVSGQQHSFSTHERMFFWKFSRQKMSEGTRNPNLRIHGKCSNPTIWAFRARYLLSHVCEYWIWWYRYFLNNVSIWNVNCVQATAFIFDTRTDVLLKVTNFLRQKMSRPEGDSNPQHSDSYRMLKPLELSGPGICCPIFVNTGSGGIEIIKIK